MRARWILNLVLLVLVAALALVIRLEVIDERTPETLAGIDPADLRLIAVERAGEPAVRLERDAQGWRLRAPLAADGEQGQVDKLLEILAAPVHRSFPERASARAELGLDPPRILLRLDGLTLAVGGLDPVTQRRYVSSDGVVHMIDDRFYAPLIAAPLDYVSRAPATRGRPPVFGTLNGVPLAAVAVQGLAGVRAERVEPLTGELDGEPLTLKSADGSALRFLVSEDRRRLSRVDLKLRYVLADPLVLDLDPTALDPVPTAPAPDLAPDLAPDRGGADRRLLDPSDLRGAGGFPDPLDPGGPPTDPGDAAGTDAHAPFEPPPDPEAPVPGDDSLGAPPEVRLSPDRPEGGAGGGFGAEPYKDTPQGFGVDPFAPDPALDPALDPAPSPAPSPGGGASPYAPRGGAGR